MTKPITSFKGEYEFLSNFYPVIIDFEGDLYGTLEHAFQAAKTTNPEERAKVRTAATPGKAKYAGKRVTLRPDWESVKLQIMEDLLRQKFSIQPFKFQLLYTRDAELVEGNTWNDTFWGVCRGKGLNHLGKLLMKIRDELKKEADSCKVETSKDWS